MNEKKRVIILIFILASVALTIAGVTIAMLYKTALDEQREMMISTAQSQARTIESIEAFESEFAASPEEVEEATLKHIILAHKKYKGIGETGEFTLAKREGDNIVFLLSHRYYDLDKPKPVPMNSKLAEPMRRALLGLSGSVIGLDYRGQTVLAAYEPVAGLNYGVVAKIDLAEIRAPFVKTSTTVLVFSILVVLGSALLFIYITDPIIKRIKQHSEDLASLVAKLQKREKELQQARDQMELRVFERTKELAFANEQLVLESQKRARVEARLRALWKLTRMADFEEKELYDHILSSAMNFTQSEFAFLALLSPDGGNIQKTFWSGNFSKNDSESNIVLKDTLAKSGIWAEAVSQKKVIADNDFAFNGGGGKGFREGFGPIHRILVVPIQGLNGITAVLAVLNKLEEFSHEDVRQLEAFIIGAQIVLDQREMKARLVESEEKYSALVENSLTGIFISSSGKILFSNRRFAESHGYVASGIVGMQVRELIHPEDIRSYEEYEREALGNRQFPIKYSLRWLTQSGKTAWTTVSNAVIDYQGKPAIVWNVNDITQIMQLERALSESEQECRLLSREVLKAQENERKRLAGEIHDAISQSLAALKFRIEDYAIKAEERTGETPEDLKFMVGIIQKILKEVNRIMNDLRPAGLDELGILAAITDFCNEFQATYPAIKIFTKIGMIERDVPDHIKAPAFRILQESLHNAAKHSNADKVEVHFGTENHILTLIVKDNGVGFRNTRQSSKSGFRKGLGLYSMQERAELSGGSLEISSSPGEGTQVLVGWRLENEYLSSKSVSCG